MTTSISSRRNHTITTQCFVQDVLPASGQHSCNMQVSSVILQNKVNDLLLGVIDTQHPDSHHKTVFQGRLSQDQCEKCSNSCWLPCGNSSEIQVLWKQGSCLLIFLLFVLETSQYPSGLCLEEVTLFFRLDGEIPSSDHIIFGFNLPHIDEIKHLVVNRGFVL